MSRYNSYRVRCALCCAHIATCRSAHAAVSSAMSCAVSQPKSLPQQRYNICFANPPLARSRARAVARPCARSAVSWPLLAVSQGAWASCRRVPNCAMSRYNLLYCDPTFKNKRAVAQPAFRHPFFSLIFFFHFILPTGRLPKKNFHFPVEPKIFILNFFFMFYTL